MSLNEAQNSPSIENNPSETVVSPSKKVRKALTEEEKQARKVQAQERNKEFRSNSILRGEQKEDRTIERDRKKFQACLESMKTEEALPEPNLKKVLKLRKSLAKLGSLYPNLFAENNLDPSQWVYELVRVMEYGSTGRLVLRDDEGKVVENSPFSISEVMRAKHEYYNMLLEAGAPARDEIRTLLEGPKWVEGLAHQKIIEATQQKRNTQNYMRILENEKRNPDEALVAKYEAEVSLYEKELEELFKTRKKMQVEIGKEVRDNSTAHKETIDLLKKKRAAEIRKARNLVRPLGAVRQNMGAFRFPLFDGDYGEIEQCANQSFESSLKSTWVTCAESHFRYETNDGERPSNLVSYEKWDGVGVLTTSLTQQDRKTTVGDVMAGNGAHLRIRPLVESDLPIYGLGPGFLDKRATRCDRISRLEASGNGRAERIQTLKGRMRSYAEEEELRRMVAQETEIQRLRNANEKEDVSTWYVFSMRMGQKGSGLWVTLPINLHRPLSDDLESRLVIASIHTKKIGLRKVNEVKLTIKRPPTPLKTEGETVEVRTCSLVMPDGNIRIATLTGAHEENTSLYLPRRIEGSLKKSMQLHGYIKEHFSYAASKLKQLQEAHPTLSGKLNLQGRSGIRYEFRKWVRLLKEKHGEKYTQSALSRIFSKIRDIHAENKDLARKSGTYGGDYDGPWTMVTMDFCESFNLSRPEASFLAVFALFMERYDHLYPWATTLRERALRYRREIYRTLSARLASSYKTVRYIQGPDTNCTYTEQLRVDRLTAMSSLEGSLKNAASREGTAFRTK